MGYLKRSLVRILLWLLKILGSIFNVIIAINVIRARRRYNKGGNGSIGAMTHVLMRMSNLMRFLVGERRGT